MKRLALALCILITTAAASLAQNVTVIGPITPGDCTMFSSTTVIKDGGFPCPGSGGTLNLPNGTTATTQGPGDNTTKVATDAYVENEISRNSTHFSAGGTTTGSANAQVISTVSPPVFSLTGNPTVTFIAGFSNSGATTLNVASSGVINILKKTPAGLVALVTGDLVSGQQYLVTYDGTQYELQTPSQIVNSQLGSMAANTVKCNNTGGAAPPIDCTQTQLTALINSFTSGLSGAVPASGGGTANFLRADGTFAAPPGATIVANVVSFGAVDDCVTDSTTAFQNAINAAAASGGQGIVYIPPVRAGGCFLVGAINATGLSNFIIQGNGDKSLIEPHGSSPVNHNWFDLSIASNVILRDFKVGYDGSTVPNVLFMMGMTAGARPTGIRFNHVTIASHTTSALVFAFGNAANNAQNTGLSCQDSTWTQLHNGASTANPYARNTTIDLDGSNIKGLASDYVTFTSGLQGTLKVDLTNCMFVDFPAGFGSGSRDNNAGAIFNLIGEFNMTSGGFRCVCFTDLVIWGTGGGSSENLIFTGVDWESSDGSSATVEQLILLQNATMGNYTFTQPFWAQPIQSMLVLGDACGANCGGVIRLRITAPDINNSNGATLIGDTNCAGFTTTNPWIAQSYIEAEGFTILSCGVIDSHTSIITPGTITSGGADNSRHQ